MTSRPAPLISVVVPSFNEEPDAMRASLQSLLDQTFGDFECILVDESTLSERASACAEFCRRDERFIYIHPAERLGLARSLNLGIARARGRLIARFDSDDLCMPERFAVQVAFLQANPDVSVVGGALEIIDEEGRTTAFRSYPLAPAEVAKGMHLTNTMAHPTVMFRRETVATHGGYDAMYRFAEDLDLWLRWLNAGVVFANVPQVVVRYRQVNARRATRHYLFYLRARIHNLAGKYLMRRVIGISGMALWTALPDLVQEQVFRALIFRRKHCQGQK